jgi:hypothetical protein
MPPDSNLDSWGFQGHRFSSLLSLHLNCSSHFWIIQCLVTVQHSWVLLVVANWLEFNLLKWESIINLMSFIIKMCTASIKRHLLLFYCWCIAETTKTNHIMVMLVNHSCNCAKKLNMRTLLLSPREKIMRWFCLFEFNFESILFGEQNNLILF